MSIHPTSIVEKGARIGRDVCVGPFTIIYSNVSIGDNTVIDGYCEIGYPTPLAQGRPLEIGPDSLIRSHSILYEGSCFGERLVTGHRVTVREGVLAGTNLQIGTLSDFQGDCIIGDYVRTHSNVHIGKLSKIGDYVWIFPYVVLTNDPHPPSNHLVGVTVDQFAVIATMSVILPGVKVGARSLVAAHSMVSKDVPPRMVVGGAPAKVLTDAALIQLKDGSGQPAYPWHRHFRRGYPDNVIAAWDADLGGEGETGVF